MNIFLKNLSLFEDLYKVEHIPEISPNLIKYIFLK